MLENDIEIRTCDPEEAKRLHQLNKEGNYFYNFWSEGGFEYHYIIVDDLNYRLQYIEVAPKKLKFTGVAVEIDSPSSEFVDDDEDF